jgi:hypothetical protein
VKVEPSSLCPRCLYRDARPELGSGDSLIYCMKKERVVAPKRACELFTASTERSREDLNNSIYGTFSEEEEI